MEGTYAATVSHAAGFWRRFVAALVDSVVLTVVTFALRLLPGTGLETLVSVAVSIGYFTFFHGRTGQTPGDAALSIVVVDLETGRPGIGYSRAAGRWFVSIFSLLAVGLGYFAMLWDSNRQTWHDRTARTLPVYVGS